MSFILLIPSDFMRKCCFRYTTGNIFLFPQSVGHAYRRSMIRPCSSTMIQSEFLTVERRWAMTNVVRPFIRRIHTIPEQSALFWYQWSWLLHPESVPADLRLLPWRWQEADAVPGLSSHRLRSAWYHILPEVWRINPSALASFAAATTSSSVASSFP